MTSNLVRGRKDVALNSIKRFWFNGILKVIVLLYVLMISFSPTYVSQIKLPLRRTLVL